MKRQLSTNFKDVTVLFQNNKYSIEKYLNERTGRHSIVLIKDGWFTDFPCIYTNGTIVLDFPERWPQYVLKKARSIAKSMNLVNHGNNKR